MNTEETPTRSDFIRQIINDDNDTGKHDGRVQTRFPPEPNGYLHIGHAKSICLNFGLSEEYQGKCNLRFDDTNPLTEDTEYVDSIRSDVRWLGFDWDDREYYASNYFDQLYDFAVQLIQAGKAYVCDLNPEEVSEYRGPWNGVGKESPGRSRTVEENLDLFERMKSGEFKDGEKTLRAKIDMGAKNMNMRDPTIYRIRHASHHRSGDKWCIYPMYDFTHGLSDSIERITHSICTLEFENHRPLYDWFLEQLGVFHPQQIEFARLNLTYTVLSKRKLLSLVKENHVDGWDDPRMPTISGYRRRGYTPESIRNFCKEIGVTKYNSLTDIHLLERSIREHLNRISPRVMGVLNPLKVVIENFPEEKVEYRDAVNNPEDPAAGTRPVAFTRELYIERDDFMEDPPRKFFRLAPGKEVRLRYAYFLKCEEVIKDPVTGEVTELRCSYDPETSGGHAPDGRKVKGTIHWVSASESVQADVRLYEHLFSCEDPNAIQEGDDWRNHLNANSVQVLEGCRVEACLASASPDERYQFERKGYFCLDRQDSTPEKLVFNRTVTLKDTWAKVKKKTNGG
ncbi:MAG: glutamine--tRNA ligase/YqeY domain fusion protein [Planctomycetota bacterium]|jgi:glutaminyl-tRNA synthetase|nr:glutamine--tRNA ligase/YqeY domain fusion protein [Planctomycetota bacterium]MEC7450748.1 glutamine--tRNA ligase/YqeY domain fusion protein [Planctomycetota bacterium]MEC7718721.1 glutamine--tRNA ligase/YqeY domain fusion protein [Planctomycetota bacterium]MEC7977557.1 glutamine--tRNA ligase/YqeY domain fusion protein [Planctomycetota bacterium]MEC8591947.1 glutamine--tRNA ligase/YqeY domain fusion protein [Planctomycetota bacterium]